MPRRAEVAQPDPSEGGLGERPAEDPLSETGLAVTPDRPIRRFKSCPRHHERNLCAGYSVPSILVTQPPPWGLYQLQVMSRTARARVETPSKKSSVRQRRDIIRNWVVGSGLLSDVPDTHSMSEEDQARVWKTVYDALDKGISALRRGALE